MKSHIVQRAPMPELLQEKTEMPSLSLVTWIDAWRRYRAAVAELSGLSERDLAELGLAREDIHEVARRSAGL